MAKILYLWCGELGWEIVSGIAGVNHLVSEGHEVAVCTFPSSMSMYADMDVEMTPPTLQDGNRYAGKGKPHGYIVPDGYSHHQIFMAADPKHSGYRGRVLSKPKVLREDIPRTPEKLIVVHARAFKRTKTGRNMVVDQFEALERFLEAGFRISFVGHPEMAAAHPDFGSDERTEDIGEMIRTIKKAALVFGPDSGPMYIAHWSLVPIFSWGCPDMRNEPRPNNGWNPFQIPCFHPWFDRQTPDNLRKLHSAYRVGKEELGKSITRLLEATNNLEDI